MYQRVVKGLIYFVLIGILNVYAEPWHIWSKNRGTQYTLAFHIHENTHYRIDEKTDRVLRIYLKGAIAPYPQEELTHLAEHPWIQGVEWIQKKSQEAVLQLTLKRPLFVERVHTYRKGKEKILKLHLLTTQPDRTQQWLSSEATLHRPFIIAVDPGHGGHDPGAIGPTGLQEKKVALEIGLRLVRMINAHPDRVGILTRETDRFVSLKDRVDWARQMGADVLISIHADGFEDPRVSGTSVYVLSHRSAHAETAHWMADPEEAFNFLGGETLQIHHDGTKQALIELTHMATRAASFELATALLQQLEKVGPVHKKNVEMAGFRVLKAPDIPSVLVETGFISHPETERKFKQVKYQEQIAEALFSALEVYLKGHPLPLIEPENAWIMQREYVVQKGDSLAKIAQRLQISLDQLRMVNDLTDRDVIYPKQVLKLP